MIKNPMRKSSTLVPYFKILSQRGVPKLTLVSNFDMILPIVKNGMDMPSE